MMTAKATTMAQLPAVAESPARNEQRRGCRARRRPEREAPRPRRLGRDVARDAERRDVHAAQRQRPASTAASGTPTATPTMASQPRLEIRREERVAGERDAGDQRPEDARSATKPSGVPATAASRPRRRRSRSTWRGVAPTRRSAAKRSSRRAAASRVEVATNISTGMSSPIAPRPSTILKKLVVVVLLRRRLDAADLDRARRTRSSLDGPADDGDERVRRGERGVADDARPGGRGSGPAARPPGCFASRRASSGDT